MCEWSWSSFTDSGVSPRLAGPPGVSAGRGAASRSLAWDSRRQPNLCVAAPSTRGPVGPVEFACFVCIDCTDSVCFFLYNVICAFFFLQLKKKKTQEKKILKNPKKNTKKSSVSRYTLYREQEHTLQQHTDLHCGSSAQGSS